MAGKLKSKKRKHSTDVVESDANIDVQPVKKKEKKHKNDGTAESTCHEVIVEESTEATNIPDKTDDTLVNDGELNFSKDFKMLSFRNKLRGKDFITELRHFLHLATNSRPQLIGKYIEKRGKPLELIEALDRIDKTNVLHVAYLCEALQLVTMEIVSRQKNHIESALHACRYFLKNHSAVVDILMRSTQLRHRCIALKLLTAMVCVEPQLGRQLLSTYDILSHADTISNLLLPNNEQSSEEDNEITVRKCYIHLVLSFLIDGNILLIRSILDRIVIIRALITGLAQDDHVTVCLVLNTLKQYILECPHVTKTKKIHVFDVDTCRQLARLYDWRLVPGDVQEYVKKGMKRKRNVAVSIVNDSLVKEQREAICIVLQEFLSVLLTSRKHGIAFEVTGNAKRQHKQNIIQGKFIGMLWKPWCNEFKTKLVVKILKACPDLARHTVRNFSGIVNMIRTPKHDWVNAVNFLATIIATVTPKLLNTALDKLTLADYTHWIKDICLPIETLVLLNGSKALIHVDYTFRLATTRLLGVMFQQYSNFMEVVRRREATRLSGVGKKKIGGGNRNHDDQDNNVAGADAPLRRFRFDLLNHILTHFPTVERILNSLQLTTEVHSNEVSLVRVHLESSLDLVLAICKENPSFVTKTNTIVDFLSLLRPLYANDGANVDHNADGNTNVVNEQTSIEMKAIQTILLLSPRSLEPGSDLFANVLRSFVRAFAYDCSIEGHMRREAGTLLRDIFRNTGMFTSGAEFEIDLWLEPLRYCSRSSLELITAVLIEVFEVTGAEVELPKPAEIISHDFGGDQLSKLFENIERGYCVQAYVESLSISKLMPLIFKGVTIVPGLVEYLETVSLLLLHYFPTPLHVRLMYGKELTALNSYMDDWLMGNTDGKQTKSSMDFSRSKKQKLLRITGLEQIHDYVVLPSNTSGTIGQIMDEIILSAIVSDRIYLLYVQQILFLVAQLVAQKCFDREQAIRAAESLSWCVNAVQQRHKENQEDKDTATMKLTEVNDDSNILEEMLQYIFAIRIMYISGGSDGDSTHLNFLHFVRMIAVHCNNLPNFVTHTANYRLKIVKRLSYGLNAVTDDSKQFSSDSNDDAKMNLFTEYIGLVSAFQLDAANCLELLHQITHHNNMTDKELIADWRLDFKLDLMVSLLQRLTILLCTTSTDNSTTTTTINKKNIPLQSAVEECTEFVDNVVALYINCVSSRMTIFLEHIEVALEQFLLIAPQHVAHLDDRLFQSMFTIDSESSTHRRTTLSKAAVRLAVLLLERNEKILSIFLEQVLTKDSNHLLEQRELYFPLFDVALRLYGVNSIPNDVLQRAFNAYKAGCMKMIEKPQKAGAVYRTHGDCCVIFIDQHLPPSECMDFCRRNMKFDSIELNQMRLIETIYQRAFTITTSIEQRSQIFVNFVQLQLQMMAFDLKRQSLDMQKLQLFAYFLQKWCQLTETSTAKQQTTTSTHGAKTHSKKNNVTKEVNSDDNLKNDELQLELHLLGNRIRHASGSQWMNFCRAALKLSMINASADPNLETIDAQKAEEFSALLLQLLAYLCDQLYSDDNDGEDKINTESPAELFQMICTHSKFRDILLQKMPAISRSTYSVKEQILHLLCVLGRKSPLSLSDLPIPVLLGCYQARLTAADRYTLALLQLFENHQPLVFQQYRPLIWGESAIAFYALRNEEAENSGELPSRQLEEQETTISQVMSLIERPVSEYTLQNFPIWRKLNAIEQLPIIQFPNPLKAVTILPAGANVLERRIEAGDLDFDSDILRLCPKSEAVYEKCYDPAFFVPVLNMCFAPEAYTHTARPVQNGLLAMCFAALSSRDRDMRLAAACGQQRYRDHFAQRKFYERPLWLQAYDNIQAGLAELRDTWMRDRRNSGTPRVPHISAIFIGHTFNLTMDPTHPLYRQLTMYLRLKSTFDFKCVPEFNVLFYSSEVEHLMMRQFVLELIRSGIKSSADLYLVVRTHVLKVLLGFYGTSFIGVGEGISTLEINLLILSVLSTCAKIPAGVRLMIEDVGILSWLHSVISSVEFHQFDVIEGLISIINNLWYSMHALSDDELYNRIHLDRELHRILLLLAPHLSARISVVHFSKFLNILHKTAGGVTNGNDRSSHVAMSADQLENLISCAEKHFSSDHLMQSVSAIRNIKIFGSTSAAPTASFISQLHANRTRDVAIVALTQLRAYTINWSKVNSR